VLLNDQDRSLWKLDEIQDGKAMLERAIALRGRSPEVVPSSLRCVSGPKRARNLRFEFTRRLTYRSG
jgi:RNA polymerase sigma-70 factor, ECF subfamily